MSKPFKSRPKTTTRPQSSRRRLRLEALEERAVPTLFPASTPVPLPAGSLNPTSVAVGDFNGDGKPDLATTNANSNNVTVLLNDGSGGFFQASGSPVGVGSSPFGVAVGDFNGDGKQDLATANGGSNNVTILLGNGDGTFTQPPGSPVTVGISPRGVAVGDFNGDGKQDLATANFGVGSGDVTVLLGNGSGGFGAGTSYAAGTNPRSVAVGDFNGDGKQDLAAANFNSDNVTILLGNGSGGFAQPPGSPVTVGDGPYTVVVGDFNGDGRPDLATVNQFSNDVSVLLGDGAGGFSVGSNFAVGTSPRGLAVGDFNGDGKLDLAAANNNSHTVTVLLGDGSGGFSPAPGTPLVGRNPLGVGVGDFNGDGLPDLATPNDISNSVSVLLNRGATTTSLAASANPVQAGSPVTLTATVANPPGGGTPDGSVTFFDGTTALGTATLSGGVAVLAVPGLSAGSHPITARYGGSSAFVGSTSAPLALQVTPAPAPPTPVVVSGSADGAAQTYTFDASGNLQPQGAAFTPFGGASGAVRAATGDFDGDGTPDTVYGIGPGGGSAIRVVTSGGIDVATTIYESTFTGGVFLAAGDIDGDGKGEIVVSPDQGGGGRVVVFKLENGQLARIADFFGIEDPSFRGGARVAVGDVNGDGTPDVIVAAGFGGGPRVAVFDGKSVLADGAAPQKLLGDFFAFEETLRNGVFVGSGDFNGDGKSDLIFGGGPGGGPRVMILDAAKVMAGDVAGAIQGPLANFFAGDPNQRGGIRVAAKDIDGDNLADLVTGSGEGFPAHVRTYTGKAVQATGGQGEPALQQDFAPFGGAVTAAGVFVG